MTVHLDPNVWRIVQERDGQALTATCMVCADETPRRVDTNCTRHEKTAAHTDRVAVLNARKERAASTCRPRPMSMASDKTYDPRAYLSNMGMHKLLESFARHSDLSSRTMDEASATPMTGTNNSPPAVNRDDRDLAYNWNLFEANGGMEVDVSPEVQGAARIAAALLDYLDAGPIDDGVSDDDAEGEPAEHSEEEQAPAPDPFQELRDAREREQAQPKSAAHVQTDDDTARHWYPWPSRITCTLDILMHLPRSVFSHRQLDLFLWLLRVNGVQDVPSVKSMQTLNESLQKMCGIETIGYDGKLGHRYYVNSIADIIAQELANPKVRPHLRFFPEDSGDELSEARQAKRWLHELPDDQLTPMVRVGKTDFYIYEPTYTHDQTYCIPTRFFTKGEDLMARCWKLEVVNGPTGSGWRVIKSDDYVLNVNQFLKSFPQISRDAALYGIPDPSNILYVVDPTNPDATEPWTFTDSAKGNKWREIAEGARVVAFPMWMYCDDTSGNLSKKWNEHNSFLFTPAGLPRSEASKEYNVHFLSTSNLAAPLEMLDGIADQIEEAQGVGIWAWDCVLNEPVLVIPSVIALLGDNPMQSEFACHIGLRGKLFCRVCEVLGKDAKGGQKEQNTQEKQKEKERDEARKETAQETSRDEETVRNEEVSGEDVSDDSEMASNADSADSTASKSKRKRRKFVESLEQMVRRVKAFIKPGKPRKAENTKEQLRSMFTVSKTLGSENKLKEMRTQSGVKDTYQQHFLETLIDAPKSKRGVENRQAALDKAIADLPENIISPVWRLKGLDPHSDTPVEILHVILLGFVKYFWRDVINNQIGKNEEKKKLLATRLSSLDVSGLGISPLNGTTLVKYAGSLVGRDFRVIAQVAPYVIYDMVSEECRQAWIALSKLIPLVWQPKIDNLDSYVTTLRTEIESFLVTTAKWTNRWFNKPKFHVIVHLPDHILRFGPAMLFATEAFESFNAVIRAKSVHSNRHAPSRDIARGFAQGNRIRHLLSGGLFLLHQAASKITVRDDENDAAPRQRVFSRVASDWTSVGAGPRLLVATPSTVTEYLGHGKTTTNRGMCILDQRAEQAFSSTLTGRTCLDYHDKIDTITGISLGRSAFRQAKLLRLQNGDDCKIGTFIIIRDTSQLTTYVGCLREVLRSTRSVTDSPSVILVERGTIKTVPAQVAMYGMPTVKLSGIFETVPLKNVLCSVNVQHDCASQVCKASGTVPVYQERRMTAQTRARVVHTAYNDHLLLNTAQMRDGSLLQPYRLPGTAYTASDIDHIIHTSAIKELPTKKKRKTQAPTVSTATSSSISTSLRQSIPPSSSPPAQSRPQPRLRSRPSPLSSVTSPIPPGTLASTHLLTGAVGSMYSTGTIGNVSPQHTYSPSNTYSLSNTYASYANTGANTAAYSAAYSMGAHTSMYPTTMYSPAANPSRSYLPSTSAAPLPYPRRDYDHSAQHRFHPYSRQDSI